MLKIVLWVILLAYIGIALVFFKKYKDYTVLGFLLCLGWLPLILFAVFTKSGADRSKYDDAMRTKEDGTKIDLPLEV